MPEISSPPPTLWLPALLLGIGLAASSGLRTFLPLLLLGGAVRFQFFGVHLNESFAWLSSDLALITLGIAAVAEMLGDKVPAVDHLLDAAGTLTRPAAGALATTAVLSTQDPAVAALAGLIVGAPLALGVHSAKAGSRGASTVATAGIGNPILSVLEDIAALFLGLVSLLAPILVPLLLGIAGLLLWKVYRLARRFRPRATP